ncbi:MAG: oligosaccharide flippase family protein [Deltaproteobacteria bacterium]|nr:oligosaccharide flippase family protein [Deltaproteobacteria bacterium]
MAQHKMFKQFSHFFGATVIAQLLGLVTFPILTRLLSIEQYGTFALIGTTAMLIVPLGKLGLSEAVIRFYARYSRKPPALAALVSTGIFASCVLGAITAGTCLVLLAGLYWLGVFPNTEMLLCFLLLALPVAIRPTIAVAMSFMRVLGRSSAYAKVAVLSRIITSLLGLLCLWTAHGVLSRYYIGTGIGDVLLFLALWLWLRRNFSFAMRGASSRLARKMIRFGAPMVISEMGYVVLSYADRYMLAAIAGTAAAGLYSAGYNLVNYIGGSVMFAVSYAVTPAYVEAFQSKGRKGAEKIVEQAMTYLLSGAMLVMSGYFSVSRELIIVLASYKYLPVVASTNVILFGVLVLTINEVLKAGLYLEKRSGMIMFLVVMAAVLNLVLNWMLIPVHGVMGAAIATLGAACVLAAATWWTCRRCLTVRVDTGRLIGYGFAALTVLLVLRSVALGSPGATLVAKLLVGGTICAAWILALERHVVLRFLRGRDQQPAV